MRARDIGWLGPVEQAAHCTTSEQAIPIDTDENSKVVALPVGKTTPCKTVKTSLFRKRPDIKSKYFRLSGPYVSAVTNQLWCCGVKAVTGNI